MIAYFVVLILSVSIAWVGRRSKNTSIRRSSIGAVVIFLTFFAGLRSGTVGTDTGNYIQMLGSVNSVDDIWRTTEIGYNALMLVCNTLSDDYSFLLTTIAFIVVSNYIFVIVRSTKRYETALFMFIILGMYTFFFNGARQGIAMSICFLALPSLLERRRASYFLLVALAALFHHTALIAAPIYFLAGSRTGWKQVVAVIISAMILMAFLNIFVQIASLLLDDKYAVYAEEGEGGGRVMAVFLVSQGLLLYFLKPSMRDMEERYQRLLNIYLIGLIPAVAATLSNVNPSGLLRLNTYFSHTAILLWPMVFAGINNNLARGLASLAFLIITVAFFALTTSAFSNLVPYHINARFTW